MGKLTLLVGAGIGYVLGARAGRERYDEIEEQARRLWRDPRVRRARKQAGETVEQASDQVADQVDRTGTPGSGGDTDDVAAGAAGGPAAAGTTGSSSATAAASRPTPRDLPADPAARSSVTASPNRSRNG